MSLVEIWNKKTYSFNEFEKHDLAADPFNIKNEHTRMIVMLVQILKEKYKIKLQVVKKLLKLVETKLKLL